MTGSEAGTAETDAAGPGAAGPGVAGLDAFAHCAGEVRAQDKDRYLAALFAPEDKRPHLMALYAFNLELARVPDLVSEPTLGEIRLQWWRETIEQMFAGQGVDHPVARALSETVAAARLPQATFETMIEARRFDLYREPVPDIAFLEGYAGETAAALIQLASVVLCGERAAATAEAAGHAGVAMTIVAILRAFALHRARGRVLIPDAMLARHRITADDVLNDTGRVGLAGCLTELRQKARDHLASARASATGMPGEALPAFLPVALLDLYLDRMARPGLDPYGEIAEVSQLRRQWRLWRAARKRRF